MAQTRTLSLSGEADKILLLISFSFLSANIYKNKNPPAFKNIVKVQWVESDVAEEATRA